MRLIFISLICGLLHSDHLYPRATGVIMKLFFCFVFLVLFQSATFAQTSSEEKDSKYFTKTRKVCLIGFYNEGSSFVPPEVAAVEEKMDPRPITGRMISELSDALQSKGYSPDEDFMVYSVLDGKPASNNVGSYLGFQLAPKFEVFPSKSGQVKYVLTLKTSYKKEFDIFKNPKKLKTVYKKGFAAKFDERDAFQLLISYIKDEMPACPYAKN